MSRFTLRSFVDDALFVVVIMVAAMASAALETRAVLSPTASTDSAVAAAIAPLRAARPAAVASSVDGTLLSAAANRSPRGVR
jgi:hypothetical protein